MAVHDCEFTEPAIDEERADDAYHNKDEDDRPLVEYVREAATVCLVHAQEETAVRCQACQGVRVNDGERRFLMLFYPIRSATTPTWEAKLELDCHGHGGIKKMFTRSVFESRNICILNGYKSVNGCKYPRCE